MILMTRADDRLIHGMVAVSWTSHLKPQTILVANDVTAKDEFKSMTMKMAQPAGVKLIIKTLDDSIKALNTPINDNKHIVLVVESVADALYIYERINSKFQRLNVGTAGVNKKEGEEYIPTLPQVFMTAKECECAEKMAAGGVEIFAQITPTRERMEFKDIGRIFKK